MQTSLAIALLALITAADPPAPWKLPDADGQKWAARVRKAVARDGWAVEVRGNDIAVRRNKPVVMASIGPNAAPNAKPSPDGERAIRFVLRFAPKMSVDEYERLAEVNAASGREYERLHKAVGLPHKFDEFIAATPEERVRAFREAVAKLPRHELPDLYTPDHSVHFLHPWDGWASPSDKVVAAECGDVQNALMRYFGMYDPAAAAGGQGVGRHLAEPRR